MTSRLIVHTVSQQLFWPGGTTGCTLGKNGVIAAAAKQEGDGMTPLGVYPLRAVYFRADRINTVLTSLPLTALAPDMGWCDCPQDANYNKPVRHPYAASAEQLWREDGLYDVIVVLGHNDSPVEPGKGSAIFLHCCTYGQSGEMKPTLGCVAVPRDMLLALLQDASATTTLHIS